MSLPIINDFNKPQLSKTEKAISMLQAENDMIKNWNQGLQRQIAGLCIHLKIKPKDFSENTRNKDEINKFLLEAQQAEELIIKAEHGDNEAEKSS